MYLVKTAMMRQSNAGNKEGSCVCRESGLELVFGSVSPAVPNWSPFGLDPDGDDGVQERLTGRLDSGEEEADYKYKVIWVVCSTTKRPERVHMGDLGRVGEWAGEQSESSQGQSLKSDGGTA